MNYIASLSCGKDSLAMVLRLIEENKPLTHCVIFDTGMEFQCIYNNLEKLRPILYEHNIELVVLKPQMYWLEEMLLKVVNKGKPNEHYGYDWCFGACRWQTSNKQRAIREFYKGLEGDYVQYIGIALDEPKRAKNEENKVYPLIEWGMTEKDCLEYCYSKGWHWIEDGVELYSILDRVSCWCCGNKNLKELKNIYLYLPTYWTKLKALQSRIDRPFRRDGKTIFDLEKRFEQEENQIKLDI